MSQFQSKLLLEDEKGLPYTLVAPLTYHSDLLEKDVVVPEGFKTDLASIPRGLWNLLPKSGGYDKPAVIHDYLYVKNGVTRDVADAVLREAMEVMGVGRVMRWMIYSGVRAGGWVAWNHYRESGQ